jgi:predicted nucleic acid-binding protein
VLNLYFDTSAFLKLLVVEEGSTEAALLWSEADRVTSSRLLYVEARAALAAAARVRRVRGVARARLRERLDAVIREVNMVELNPTIALASGDLAERYSLRAGDAIHLASALASAAADRVVASWDISLRRAATAAGMAVAPVRPT